MIFSKKLQLIDEIVEFRLEANVNTYAANMNKTDSTRLSSQDFKSKVSGDLTWFQGYEEIYWMNEKVYECNFHGGLMRK